VGEINTRNNLFACFTTILSSRHNPLRQKQTNILIHGQKMPDDGGWQGVLLAERVANSSIATPWLTGTYR
jgi:hypothetical protein